MCGVLCVYINGGIVGKVAWIIFYSVYSIGKPEMGGESRSSNVIMSFGDELINTPRIVLK